MQGSTHIFFFKKGAIYRAMKTEISCEGSHYKACEQAEFNNINNNHHKKLGYGTNLMQRYGTRSTILYSFNFKSLMIKKRVFFGVQEAHRPSKSKRNGDKRGMESLMDEIKLRTSKSLNQSNSNCIESSFSKKRRRYFQFQTFYTFEITS